MSYLYREDLVPLCIPVWRNMWPFYGTLLGGKKKLKSGFNLTLQPQGETQGKSRSFYSEGWSCPILGSREPWCLLCMQMTGISQVLLNLPVQLGCWSWEHLVCSASCGRLMYQSKCSLQNVFFHHTPSKQPANALAFQEKIFKSVFHAWQISLGGAISAVLVVCIMTCFEEIILSLHPPLWLPGNWGGFNSFKMFKQGRKADTTAQIWLWAQNNKLSKA